MKPNGIKKLWAENKPVINGWLSIGNAFTAEIMAAQGYDSVTADGQHGVVDYADMVSMFQAVQASGATPMARVPWLEPGAIMRALDAGAYGIICPMINTREEAELLVSYMRYPPHGSRSFGPTRVNFSAGANYAAEANDEILCLAMIETDIAMDNLEAIVATPGLDGVYVGPADLTLGMTQGRLAPGFDREEPEMVDAIKRILEVSHANGIRAGIQCGASEYAAKAVGWGYDLVTLLSDVRLLAGGAAASVAKARELIGEDVSGATESEKASY